MKKNFRRICQILFLILLSSCGSDYIFEGTYEISDGQWTYADTIDFQVNIPDTLSIYNLYLEVEHTSDYPFQNLYVNIYTNFPEGQRLQELVSLELTDQAGFPYGECSGKKCRIDIPIQQNAYFSSAGTYLFTIEQFMRRDTLPGLKSFSFRIEDTGKARE